MKIDNTRIHSIDILRGIAMVVMALDHTRDFFSNFAFDPTDLAHTTPLLFFIRWITHFCAPIFVLLIGVSMRIVVERGQSVKQTALFLLSRGVWMIFIELFVVSSGWTFNFDFAILTCQVIWVIGCGMIVLAGLIFLPSVLIFLFGISLVLGHNLLDGKEQLLLGSWSSLLHAPSSTTIVLPWLPHITFDMYYTLIPWIGIPALGYVLGRVFFLTPQQRRNWLWGIGIACILLFIVLRATNFYGDPGPWSIQKNTLFTLLSFINCTKYPPSLLYFLMTLGPAIILLSILESYDTAVTKFFMVYGKVPFFYYIIHIYLIHSAAILIAYYRYGHIEYLLGYDRLNDNPALGIPYLYGTAIVCIVWIGVVALLYPLCRWYGQVKMRHKNNRWLSYI